MGYTPVAGRLHTRYSPVRRSPSPVGKPTEMLPLDLHVLSLSLAFILSQDQTLHSMKIFILIFRPVFVPLVYIPRTRTCCLFLSNLSISLRTILFASCTPTESHPEGKAVAKITKESDNIQMFSELFFPNLFEEPPLPGKPVPFVKADAKVRLFTFIPNLSDTFFDIFFKEIWNILQFRHLKQ